MAGAGVSRTTSSGLPLAPGVGGITYECGEERGDQSAPHTTQRRERERGAAGSVRPRGHQAASTWTLVTVEVGDGGEVIWGPGQQAEAGGHDTVGGGEGRGGSHPCGTQVDIARVGDSVRREGASRGIAATNFQPMGDRLGTGDSFWTN